MFSIFTARGILAIIFEKISKTSLKTKTCFVFDHFLPITSILVCCLLESKTQFNSHKKDMVKHKTK